MAYSYVPGTYTFIPNSLRAYKKKFKVVGKNLFVIQPQVASLISLNKLLADKTALADIATKFGPRTKLGDACKKLAGYSSQYVLATAEQRAQYERAKLRYDAFCTTAKAKAAERRAKRIEAECVKARKLLAKHGWKGALVSEVTGLVNSIEPSPVAETSPLKKAAAKKLPPPPRSKALCFAPPKNALTALAK